MKFNLFFLIYHNKFFLSTSKVIFSEHHPNSLITIFLRTFTHPKSAYVQVRLYKSKLIQSLSNKIYVTRIKSKYPNYWRAAYCCSQDVRLTLGGMTALHDAVRPTAFNCNIRHIASRSVGSSF